jgi:hypothetical protein
VRINVLEFLFFNVYSPYLEVNIVKVLEVRPLTMVDVKTINPMSKFSF